MPNTQAVGVAYADPNFTSCYVDSELGYSTDAQGTVTQATSKSTTVTLNKPAGQIIMNNATLNTITSVVFTLNNTYISAKDTVILTISSGVTYDYAYNVWVGSLAAGSCRIVLRNISGSNLSDSVVLNFAVLSCA